MPQVVHPKKSNMSSAYLDIMAFGISGIWPALKRIECEMTAHMYDMILLQSLLDCREEL